MISPILGKGKAAAASRSQRAELCKCTLRATGFVVKEGGENIYVLTCAHMLTNLFSDELPISAETVGDLYHAYIMCDHVEQAFLREKEHNVDLERSYIPAKVVEVSCPTDLLLLRIKTTRLREKCGKHHHMVPISDYSPAPLTKVVMLSWPYELARTAVSGKISHSSRAYSAISENNRHGYKMKLAEVDITSDFGTSGAPLIGASTGQCVGVMQSGNGVFSYFISVDDVRKTVTKWVMT